jgi:hypothetical protein
MPRFRRALDDRAYLPAVLADAAVAASLGVRGTPTFFINGTPVIGAVPIDVFRAVIDAKLGQARELVRSGVSRSDVYAEVLRRGASSVVSPEPTDIDPIELHIAVLAACRAGDADKALQLFMQVDDAARRKLIRRDCKRFGVELPLRRRAPTR